MQRLVVLLATSLPGSFVFERGLVAAFFAYGLSNLALEALTRRVRWGARRAL